MADAVSTTALLTAAVNVLTATYGAWRWWRVEPSRAFWVLARAGQAMAIVLAVVAGVGVAAGWEPADGLFWVYALVPVGVAFVAEQFRATSAQTVLDARDLDDAAAVGRLDEAGQLSVVRAILRREMGVVAAAAGVIAFLALRAAGTA